MFKLDFARVPRSRSSCLELDIIQLSDFQITSRNSVRFNQSTTLRPLVPPRTSDSSAHTAAVRVGEVNRRECGKVPEDSRAGKRGAD